MLIDIGSNEKWIIDYFMTVSTIKKSSVWLAKFRKFNDNQAATINYLHTLLTLKYNKLWGHNDEQETNHMIMSSLAEVVQVL